MINYRKVAYWVAIGIIGWCIGYIPMDLNLLIAISSVFGITAWMLIGQYID